jgi:hypothetical protein
MSPPGKPRNFLATLKSGMTALSVTFSAFLPFPSPAAGSEVLLSLCPAETKEI